MGLVFQYPEHQLFEVDVLTDGCFGPKNQGLSQEEEKPVARRLWPYWWTSSFIASPPLSFLEARVWGGHCGSPGHASGRGPILDQPTAGLDPKGRDDILGLVAGPRRTGHDGDPGVPTDGGRGPARIPSGGHEPWGKGFDGTPEEVFRHYKELEAMGLAAPQIT